MNLKTLFTFVFVLATFQLVVVPSSPLHAQIAQAACGCGSKKCGGCIRGKLQQLKAGHKGSGTCSCDICSGQQQATSFPSVFDTQDVIVSEAIPTGTFMSPGQLPFEQAPACVANCGCQRCKLPRRPAKISCPKCDCDFCELTVKPSTKDKKCFKVEQAEVCIPAVRLPWKKACPPRRSKVRVVNRLSTKTVECPSCSYKWEVFEPQVPQTPQQAAEAAKKEAENNEALNTKSPAATTPDPEASVKTPESFDLDEVPRPPIEEK